MYTATSLIVQLGKYPLQSVGWRVSTASGLGGAVTGSVVCSLVKALRSPTGRLQQLHHLWLPFQAPSENASAAVRSGCILKT